MADKINRLRGWGPTVLRVLIGIIFIPHGYQKLFAGGMVRFIPAVAKLGFPFDQAPKAFAYTVGVVEFFGGILLILGLLTSLAALFLSVDMLVAVFKVHWHNGLTGSGGFEFPLALLAGCLALLLMGGGMASLDRALRKRI